MQRASRRRGGCRLPCTDAGALMLTGRRAGRGRSRGPGRVRRRAAAAPARGSQARRALCQALRQRGSPSRGDAARSRPPTARRRTCFLRLQRALAIGGGRAARRGVREHPCLARWARLAGQASCGRASGRCTGLLLVPQAVLDARKALGRCWACCSLRLVIGARIVRLTRCGRASAGRVPCRGPQRRCRSPPGLLRRRAVASASFTCARRPRRASDARVADIALRGPVQPAQERKRTHACRSSRVKASANGELHHGTMG